MCPARYHNNSTMWHLIASLSPPPFSTPPPPVSTHLLSQQLNLSYNRLQVLNLQNLCLPNLEKLNVSHNKIHTIQDNRKVGDTHPSHPACVTSPYLWSQCLERITHLNLSHNRLHSMDGIGAFVGVCVLNLSFNLLSLTSDLSMLVQLRRLNTLGMAGKVCFSQCEGGIEGEERGVDEGWLCLFEAI